MGELANLGSLLDLQSLASLCGWSVFLCMLLYWRNASRVRLYNEAFTGRARAIPRCSHCLADDHMASSCPSNLALPPAGMTPSPWKDQSAAPGTVPEICRNFNEERCKKSFCKYQHLCLSCHDSHPWLSCPKRRSQGRTPTANRGPKDISTSNRHNWGPYIRHIMVNTMSIIIHV